MQTTNLKANKMDYQPTRFLQNSSSTKFIPHEHLPLHIKTETAKIITPTQQLQFQSKYYEWRQKTEFPIVKIIDFHTEDSFLNKTTFLVELQTFPIRLAELKDLPLFKILYLLKESIIGVERLYNRVGSFAITPKMIVLSQTNKCKVWYNQNLASNHYQKCLINEKEFLNTICRLFESRANKLRNTISFFNQIKLLNTFCQALSFIENHARENKITISNSCRISQNQKIAETLCTQRNPFDVSLSMGRAPYFLKHSPSFSSSFTPKSKVIFHDNLLSKQSSKEYDDPSNPQMKTSGNTATDINGSNSGSQAHKSSELIQSIMFQDESNSKSVLPSHVNKHSIFTRKYSEKSQNIEIHCFTPSYDKIVWEEPTHHFGSKFNDQAFLGEEKSDEQDGNDSHMELLFSKNNWEKTLTGLFGAEASLKKSFQKGKQIRKTELSTAKLHLLDKLGKSLKESRINEESDF